MSKATRLIAEAQQGDQRAAEELLTLLYDELRRLAASKLARERPGQTLQATALVHEAYLRLIGDESIRWENRGHFFAAAATAMWRILVEAARRKAQIKHGGGLKRRELDEADRIMLPEPVDVLALNEALEKLAAEDPVEADLVKLRFFSGLTVEEAGEVLGISRTTAHRRWRFARAWLLNEIRKGDPEGKSEA